MLAEQMSDPRRAGARERGEEERAHSRPVVRRKPLAPAADDRERDARPTHHQRVDAELELGRQPEHAEVRAEAALLGARDIRIGGGDIVSGDAERETAEEQPLVDEIDLDVERLAGEDVAVNGNRERPGAAARSRTIDPGTDEFRRPGREVLDLDDFHPLHVTPL